MKKKEYNCFSVVDMGVRQLFNTYPAAYRFCLDNGIPTDQIQPWSV